MARSDASRRRPAWRRDDPDETARQAVHIAMGAFAFLLRYLAWWQAAILAASAIVFNIKVLKTVAGERLHRAAELGQPLPAGLVLYPTSVLLLLLLFPHRPDIVAAAWGILAAGDGAATLVGTRMGGRRWPWNPRKSVEGSLAFVIAGAAAGVLLAWWCRPAVVPPPYGWFTIAAPIAAALAAAAVETVPIRLDDNLSVSLTAGVVLWSLALVSEDLVRAAAPGLPPSLAVAVAANIMVAWAGYAARTVSWSGAVAGVLIGTTIFVCAGARGWVLLLAAFLCAAATSRMGLRQKTLLGIAEERGGRRGAGNAIANTGVAAVAAFLALFSYAHEPAMLAFTAALTAGASDTVASEIGKAWGRTTWAIPSFARVAPGTSGAVSLEGTAAGLVGAAALGALAVQLDLIPAAALPAVIAGAAAGSIVESLLASALEGPGILNNDALNLINTGAAAFAALAVAGTIT